MSRDKDLALVRMHLAKAKEDIKAASSNKTTLLKQLADVEDEIE